jgi:methylamine dehydrogenase light chain
MNNLIDTILEWMDRGAENGARSVAQRSGRRSFLNKAGAAMLGGTLLPMLPFDRNAGQAHAQEGASPDGDQTECEYWRYCALDGNLCNACGGTLTECPPGSEASKVSWVGTCRNPNDEKDYLVSYNDCCGKASCSSSFCFTSEGERPGYRMGLYNDINWCMANDSKGYHCTVAVLVGLAE